MGRSGVSGMKPSPYAQGGQFESPPNSGRGADVYNSAGIGVSWYDSVRQRVVCNGMCDRRAIASCISRRGRLLLQ